MQKILMVLLVVAGVLPHMVWAEEILEEDVPQANVLGADVPPIAGEETGVAFRAWVYTQLPDTPEGLGVDSQGNLYASLFHTGEIVQLTEDGQYVHIAWIPSEEDSGKGHVLGLESDKDDNLYVAYKARSKYDRVGDPRHPACQCCCVAQHTCAEGGVRTLASYTCRQGFKFSCRRRYGRCVHRGQLLY